MITMQSFHVRSTKEKPLMRWSTANEHSLSDLEFKALPREVQRFLRVSLLECGLPILTVTDGDGNVTPRFFHELEGRRTPPLLTGLSAEGFDHIGIVEETSAMHASKLIQDQIHVADANLIKGDRTTRFFYTLMPLFDDEKQLIGANSLHFEFEIDYRSHLTAKSANRLFCFDFDGTRLTGSYQYTAHARKRGEARTYTTKYYINPEGEIF